MTIKLITLIVLSVALRIAEGTKVDWENCPTLQLNCLCQKNRDDTNYNLKKIDSQDQLEDCKEIGVQVKSITDDIAIFYLQVIGAADIGPSPELLLYHADALMFGCEFKNGKVNVKFNPVFDDKLITAFEDQSTYDSNTVICAVKVINSHRVYKEAQDEDTRKGNRGTITELKLMTSKSTIVHKSKLMEARDLFAPPRLFKCNPFVFSETAANEDRQVEPIKHKERDILNCDNYGDKFTMRYEKNGDESEEMLRLECIDDPNKNTTSIYKIVIKEANLTTGEPEIMEYAPAKPDSYAFYCAAEYREACKKPECDLSKYDENNVYCPIYTPGSKGVPATYTCDHQQWLIAGAYHKLTKDPECKKNELEGFKKALFHTSYAGKEEITGANHICFKKYDCYNWSKLLLPECDNTNECGQVDHSNGVLKCADPKRKLYIGSAPINVTSFECDTTIGLYRNQAYGSPIDKYSQISCIDESVPTVKVANADLSQTTVYVIIGAVLATIIAILVGSYFLITRLCAERNKVSLKNNKAWKKLSKAEQIDYCKKAYLKVLQADVKTAENILNGLNMMLIMLETETEHKECWDEVLPFLMRFQGAMYEMDFPIWHMFSRYMYLQAKKIIDKHGWAATKRITNKNQEGLIRSVAIQLLSFALNDPFNSEAEEMVREGFTQLGFNAVNQYPHCGLMWSLIMHTRPVCLTRGPDKLAKFSKAKMHEYLKGIACEAKLELPEGDVIPEFGSIAKQAAYALGSSPDHCFLKEHAPQILTKSSHPESTVVSLSFFAGMCESLSRNPSQTIMGCCKMFPRFDPAFIAGMLQVAPASEWAKSVRKTTNLVTYYGRSSDATRITTRFMADDKEMEDQIAEIKVKQQEWEAALDVWLERIRKWFADRTDKEEFKKRPEYITKDGKGNKLDSRVSGSRTASQSASKTDPTATASKNSESSSHNSDPAASEAAAAAAAAKAV